jgi:hypothetical protein
MPDLSFAVTGVEPDSMAAVPILNFRVRVDEPTPEESQATSIHSITLRCQVQIEPARRRYDSSEQAGLQELFGTPDRWSRTLRPLIWAQLNVTVRPFSGSTEFSLPVVCSQDFSLAATRYLDAVQSGAIPLSFLFSGTIFYENPEGRLQVAQIPWEKEAYLPLPVSTWNQLLELHFANTVAIQLPKDVFDRLNEFRRSRGLCSAEQAIASLLTEIREGAVS